MFALTEPTWFPEVTISCLMRSCTTPAFVVSLYPVGQLIFGQLLYGRTLTEIVLSVFAVRAIWLRFALFLTLETWGRRTVLSSM